ncbi:hypothetical protein [Robertmurraya siralis]|nr:hypothetical protein [Robertmurraya siralis]
MRSRHMRMLTIELTKKYTAYWKPNKRVSRSKQIKEATERAPERTEWIREERREGADAEMRRLSEAES